MGIGADRILLTPCTCHCHADLVDSGPGKAGLGPRVFFIWASACLVCVVFAYLFVNETGGLTLEEVDVLYSSVQGAPIGPVQSSTEADASIAYGIERIAGGGGGQGGSVNGAMQSVPIPSRRRMATGVSRYAEEDGH